MREVIRSGPYAGRNTSDAAGRYQFLSSTWEPIARELGLKDFSTANQDKAAWHLAQEDYRRKTGRDFQSDLASKDPQRIAAVGRALHETWTSLPGGIEQGQGAAQMQQRYGRALQRQQQGGQAEATAPAGPAPGGRAYFGDSIAAGLKTADRGSAGDAVERRQPQAVLDAIRKADPRSLAGRQVVLSTGSADSGFIDPRMVGAELGPFIA